MAQIEKPEIKGTNVSNFVIEIVMSLVLISFVVAPLVVLLMWWINVWINWVLT